MHIMFDDAFTMHYVVMSDSYNINNMIFDSLEEMKVYQSKAYNIDC